MMPRRRVREADIAKMRELYEVHGYSIYEIEAEIGFSYAAVYLHLRRAGVTMRKGGMWTSPKARKRLAMRNRRIVAAAAAGIDRHLIAQRFGLSQATISKVVKEAA